MAESTGREAHPRTRLDDNFASPIRFSVMAAVGAEAELDFTTLGHVIQSHDSALSKAIAHLSQAGYVAVRKGEYGSRSRTWVRSTIAGRRAFAAHLDALKAIVELGSAGAQNDP